MSSNCNKPEKMAWKIRKMAVKQYLGFKSKTTKVNETHELYSIYFGVEEIETNDSLGFISRALVDPMFNAFAHKMPSIFKFYAIS